MTHPSGTRRRARRLLFGPLAAALLVSGCGGDSGGDGSPPGPGPTLAGSCPTGGNLALAVGARANSPAPVGTEGDTATLPGTVDALLTGLAERNGTLSVVRVDGRPSSVLTETFASEGKTDVKQQVDRRRWLSRMRSAVGAVRAEHPEADVLSGVTLAARQVDRGGTVVLLDSGLQTVDPLDFREQLLTAQPAELVAYLRSKRLLPDLSGRTLVLVGIGDSAEPQEPLDAAQRRTLVEVWTAIGEAAGGCVAVSDEAHAVGAVDGVPAVSVVPLETAETPRLSTCQDTVLRDSGSVGFVPDRDAYRDPAAARATLAGIARQISAAGLRVSLVGTTASSGTEAGRLALSRQRAERVRRSLVELGVPAGNIVQVAGRGTHWPTHVPDLAPDGRTLLPGPAARNRSVVIRVGCG